MSLLRNSRIGVVAIVLTFFAYACGGGNGQNGSAATPAEGGPDTEETETAPVEPVEVTLALPLTAPAPHHGYMSSLPDYLGYWEEEGLTVDAQGFDGSNSALTAVDAGQALVGNAGTAGVVSAHAEQSADLVAYFTDLSQNVYFPQVPEDSDIQTLQDYVGKTVGLQSLEAASYQIFLRLLEQEGIDPNEIDFVPVGTGAEVAEALRRGRIDAYQAATGLYAAVENVGVPHRKIDCEVCETVGFISAFVAQSSSLQSDRDVIVRLTRGVAKAMVFMSENPEAAVRIHWEVYPESKPTGVSDEEAMEQALISMEERITNQAPVEGQYGFSTEAQVQSQITTTAPDSEVSPNDIFMSDLLEEINDFDEAAVRAEAQDFQLGNNG